MQKTVQPARDFNAAAPVIAENPLEAKALRESLARLGIGNTRVVLRSELKNGTPRYSCGC